MENPSPQNPILHRSACAECHRRKQKCNREWPCNHCQKRKVADKCRFNVPNSPIERPPQSVGRKRSQNFDGDNVEEDPDDNSESDDDGPGLEALGYLSGPLLSSLGVDVTNFKKREEILDWVTPETCFQLKQALDVLPPRPRMDVLVQLFFNNVNYHYYIIYPALFLEEYQQWWDRRAQHRPVTIQWTSLLIMVCACATQHLDVEERPQVELDFGESSEILTERYLKVARDLANAIPDGHYHLLNVQRMLHSIYWYKAEAKFVEAWHLIGAAVRESQELGLPRGSAGRSLPEFEQEMRRRVWCILSTWDWQFASGLCRPTIIDHRDVDIPQPTLSLENLHPSPLLHMKLQSEAVAVLAARFGAPKNVQAPSEIFEYLHILEDWMRTFPQVYSTSAPDFSKDASHPWATSHRFYIHTMAYLMILNPIRAYMAKTYTKTSSQEELKIRETGVHYSLRNLDCTSQWTEHVHHRDGRFHFIIFSLFDTASVLSAALIKDEEFTIPHRAEIIVGIDRALVLLRRLNSISKTAKTSYDILSRLAKRLPRPSKYGNRKRAKVSSIPNPASRPSSVADLESRSSTADDPSGHYGLDGTSPSNSHSCESATTGSTPQSNHVVTPEAAPPNMEPTVHEHHVSSFSAGNPMAFGGYDQSAMGMDNIIQQPPQIGMGGELQTDLTLQGMAVPPMGPYADSQPVAPAAGVETYSFEQITDTELGDFSRLWDWPSLGLDFISSETASLPTAPDQ